MGGLVAWEMAQQLMKEGETISLLALIDTAPPPSIGKLMIELMRYPCSPVSPWI
jgi:thioesterase domain-containing protein